MENNFYYSKSQFFRSVVKKNIIGTIVVMATVFELTFRPILIISKLFGLIDISYTFGPSGLLVKDVNNSTYYFIVESIRLFVLITCTYLINTENTFVRHLCLLKFWVIFIASRISQGRIITYV